MAQRRYRTVKLIGESSGLPSPPAPTSPAVASSQEAAGHAERETLTVQVGAFRLESAALALLSDLQKKGYPASLREAGQESDRYFRVWEGKFESPEQALENARAAQEGRLSNLPSKARALIHGSKLPENHLGFICGTAPEAFAVTDLVRLC